MARKTAMVSLFLIAEAVIGRSMWRTGNGAQTIQRARATTYSRMRLVAVRRTKICLHIKHSTSGEEQLRLCGATYTKLCKAGGCCAIYHRQRLRYFAKSSRIAPIRLCVLLTKVRYNLPSELSCGYGSEFALPSRLRSDTETDEIKQF